MSIISTSMQELNHRLYECQPEHPRHVDIDDIGRDPKLPPVGSLDRFFKLVCASVTTQRSTPLPPSSLESWGREPQFPVAGGNDSRTSTVIRSTQDEVRSTEY